MNFLIGCDPEVFVTRDGVYQNAHGLIAGDKKYPQKVRNGAVQVDGMALEFNTTPAATEDEFSFFVEDVYSQLRLMVPEYTVVTTPVAMFTEEFLKSQPAASLELGCDPDYNAWDGFANERPDATRPMRTASGHIHIGWTNDVKEGDPEHEGMCRAAGKQMDFYLGLASIFYDPDTLRREMYGKAGAIRMKPYGVEYRTLSNAWLKSNSLTRWVYRSAVAGMQRLAGGEPLVEKYGDIQHIINTSDMKAAEKIIVAEGLEVCYG